MKYYNYITGEMTPAHLLAALTIFAIGWFVYKGVTGITRKRSSQRTPARWSWKFWIKDNWREAFLHMVISFAIVRFAPDILSKSGIGNEWVNSNDPMWIYFLAGVLKSWLLDLWKHKNAK